ncbi:MAG: glycosyltransferase [Paraclostridium bifermentans]|uniref:glycosyltransferase n=1 Tax=Paraclostridium bifermentans TaxID=1490 RepID=UPI001D5D8824|nr:glycosyltransferase [Paraclostridium bifermentans]MBS6509129.1 glycosyltransferase [Paraclostridium bifermentans]
MKGLYIARIDEEYSLDFGVAKKIIGQIDALNALGQKIDYLRLKNKQVTFNSEKFEKVRYRFLAYGNFYRLLKRKYKNEYYDFVYIRYVKGNLSLYKIIKMFSKKGAKVIIEIPTYPYDTEVVGFNVRDFIERIIDKYVTNRLKKYVFRISVTNTHKEIFGIKTININNGIDLRELPLINSNHINSINLVGIANLARWHGYDRIIQGLHNYYTEGTSKKNIMFYIIGEGSEKENLMNLTKHLNLKEKVHFLGGKTGNDLDSIFNNMHIGVSSLALFRAGGGHDPIKSKEFLGRGIPVLLGYEDKVIDMKLPYVFKVEENDNAVDIERVIQLYESCRNINSVDIREYAEKFLSWKFQMEKVINSVEGNNYEDNCNKR